MFLASPASRPKEKEASPGRSYMRPNSSEELRVFGEGAGHSTRSTSAHCVGGPPLPMSAPG